MYRVDAPVDLVELGIAEVHLGATSKKADAVAGADTADRETTATAAALAVIINLEWRILLRLFGLVGSLSGIYNMIGQFSRNRYDCKSCLDDVCRSWSMRTLTEYAGLCRSRKLCTVEDGAVTGKMQ